MYSCDDKAEVSAAITPVFSDTWSHTFRNYVTPSEIIPICWFAAQVSPFIAIINAKNCLKQNLKKQNFKRTALYEIKKIHNIINVTFDQFNASLLNKSIMIQKNS